MNTFLFVGYTQQEVSKFGFIISSFEDLFEIDKERSLKYLGRLTKSSYQHSVKTSAEVGGRLIHHALIVVFKNNISDRVEIINNLKHGVSFMVGVNCLRITFDRSNVDDLLGTGVTIGMAISKSNLIELIKDSTTTLNMSVAA